MEVKPPESLTQVKFVPQGIGMGISYAVDPEGNVWRAVVFDNVPGEWIFFKRAEDVERPTPSFQQLREDKH